MVPVVSPAWLEKHPEAVIVDLRWALGATTGYESYLEGHIPGAVFIDLDTELSAAPTVEGGRHPLPDPADFAAAMSVLAKLRPAVDAFFDKVKVNDDDKAVRENRLKLLNEIREATRAVADFSKIQD